MKGSWKQKGKKEKKKKKGNAVLQKYMEAVDAFVKSKSGSEEAETGHGLRFVKKKSRKELRKEKRKMKKAKMKSHYEGKKTVSLATSDGGDSGAGADKQQQPQVQKKKKTEKTKQDGSKSLSKNPKEKAAASETPPPTKEGKRVSKLQETRRMALLEANEQEDREIKKLERCLGLNKRKNKKSLPQSFVADGLDYILGMLDSGSSAVGVYEDVEDDMEMARENFKKLDDTQGSDEDPEAESEMESEGSDDGEDEDEMSNEEEADEDDEMSNEEEADEEMDQDELNESDPADSEDGRAGETDSPDTNTQTVSSDPCNIYFYQFITQSCILNNVSNPILTMSRSRPQVASTCRLTCVTWETINVKLSWKN